MTEQEIIHAAQSGDEEAYRILVEQHQRRVLHLLVGMVHQLDVAEELTQETFVRAWRSLRSFSQKSSFWTWIYRIAYRIGLDYIRSMRQHSTVAFEETVAGTSNDTPFEAAVQEDLRTAVWNALNNLAPEQRTAVILYYYHGLSYQEIASVMKRPLGTVRTDLHRAKKRLRQILVQRWGSK